MISILAPPVAVSSGNVMNNGRQDNTVADMQKLQQQLQDIKDQVSTRVNAWVDAKVDANVKCHGSPQL